MDYEKIGSFLAKRRKELDLTQKDVAEQLGITDRAISRWERAIGCPDISLLEPLSKALNVSILEILHGEEINENQNQVVMNLLNKNQTRIKWWKRISFFCINLIGIIFLIIFFFFYGISDYIENNPDLSMHSIISSSMLPTLQLYDEVIVKKIDIQDVSVGDIISFTSHDSIFIHRVIDKTIDSNGNVLLQTKGDSNYFMDAEFVSSSNFIGVMVYKIPYLGHFLPLHRMNYLFAFFILLGMIGVAFFDFLFFTKIRHSFPV